MIINHPLLFNLVRSEKSCVGPDHVHLRMNKNIILNIYRIYSISKHIVSYQIISQRIESYHNVSNQNNHSELYRTLLGARTSTAPCTGVRVMLKTKCTMSGATTFRYFLEMVRLAPSSTSSLSSVMSTVVSPGT